MAKKPPQFVWNGIDLEELRQVMDPPSDDAVASVFESKSMRHLSSILKSMAENDCFVPKELPTPMHNFVNKELHRSFTKKEIQHFNKTHEIWKVHGMKFIFILFFRALPYTYMAEKPANVLRMTKLLETHTERRIIETAQFVFDVMEKKWWEPHKKGILTALKVRIMHSAMRHIILDSDKQGEKWNNDWGKPISQEDLIATNQVFSLEFFKGMKMIGQPLTKEEQESWFYTWKTIGKIMGVQDNLICDSVEEAWTLQHSVYDHLFRDETHSGIALSKALVEMMDQFHMPENMVLFLMKTMLADEQFPNCFHRMLGPSYEKTHPNLFVVHNSEEGKQKHKKEVLNKQFHAHAMDYYQTMKVKKSAIKKEKEDSNILINIMNWVLGIFGVKNEKIYRIDIELKLLHKILHDVETGEPIEELEEDSILEMITIFGGIIVSFLSVHFRKGKESGFRIPKDLQENWALKG